jgi:tetratricopeptide (TPR) repeat protein
VRRPGIAAIAAVAGVILVAIAGAYLAFRDSGAPPPDRSAAAPRRLQVAVFPFAASPGSDIAWYGLAPAHFLPWVLEEDSGLQVIGPQRIRDLAGGDVPAGSEAQRELARKAGADFFVRGEVRGDPGAVMLRAVCVETATGREAGRWQAEGVSPETLGGRLDELHAGVRQAMGLVGSSPVPAPLASLIPIRAEPTRAYLEAAERLSAGDAAGCLEKLPAALALEDFHLARFLSALAAAERGDPRSSIEAAGRLARVGRPMPARVTLMIPVLQALFGSGNARSAVAPLESFLARFPDEKSPLSWLGAIELLLLGEAERAAGHLERALELGPSPPETRRLLAQARLAAGRPADAIPLYRSFLEEHAEDLPARLGLAEALRREGRREESRGELDRIRKEHPDDPGAAALLGLLALEDGDPAAARRIYAPLLGSRRAAVAAQGEELTARSHLLEGRFQEAIRLLRSAADRMGAAGDEEAQARYLLALGEIQTALGRHPEALSTLSALRSLRTRQEPELAIIQVLISQRNFDTAREMLDEHLRQWEGKVSPDVLGRLRDALEGSIALEQGRHEEAITRLEAGYARGEIPFSETLGRAYLAAGRYEKAEAIFRRITRDPGRFETPVRLVRSLARLGESCEKQGKREQALEAYREALRWWGAADAQLPEIRDAREAVTRLGR